MIYPKDVYMSPRKAIQRFCQIRDRCHPQAMDTGRHYRMEKEALIAAQFIIGIEQMWHGQHWFRNAEDLSPDVDIQVIGRASNRPSEIHFEEAGRLQITEFESHRADFLEALRSKQKPGYVPGQLELVISVRGNEGWQFVPADLAREVRDAIPTYAAVWVLTDDVRDQQLYHLVRLYPKPAQTEFRPFDVLDTTRPPDWVRMLPRYGRYEAVGADFVLQLPSCPVCGNL